jgi:8-oxo-dGTP pyrophosphatase MutT (NUDIX family)
MIDDPIIRVPGYWGLFGGGVESGEQVEQALNQEIDEELDFRIKDFQRFTEIVYTMHFAP